MATSQAQSLTAISSELMDQTQASFTAFLETYIDPVTLKAAEEEAAAPGSQGSVGITPHYLSALEVMVGDNSTTLEVDFGQLNDYDTDLARNVADNFGRVEVYLRKAIQNLVRKYHESHVETEEGVEKEFWVCMYNNTRFEALRRLNMKELGKFISFTGTVTRTSEVRPELYMATFRCQECNTIARNVEQQFKFTVPCICSNPTCGNRDHWSLVREESTFIDWQRVRVQETTDEVPAGSLPRTMDVILRNHTVEQARAGDKVVFNGTLAVVPDASVISTPGERVQSVQSSNAGGENAIRGLKSLGCRELTYRLCFLANSVQQGNLQAGVVNIRGDDDLSVEEVLDGMNEAEQSEIEGMKANKKDRKSVV